MQVDMIIVDDVQNFCNYIKGEWNIEVVDRPGLKEPQYLLTAGPFKNTEMREQSCIGVNKVAIYKKVMDGFAQIKKWDYAEKGGK
jgi:hypothetical protein